MILFSYGTLKKNYWNHHYLDGALYLGEGTTYEKYALYNYHYPFAVHEEIEHLHPVHPVRGELYEITREISEVVDELEQQYSRKSRPIISDNRGLLQAFVYEFGSSEPYGFKLMCDLVDGAYIWRG